MSLPIAKKKKFEQGDNTRKHVESTIEMLESKCGQRKVTTCNKVSTLYGP